MRMKYEVRRQKHLVGIARFIDVLVDSEQARAFGLFHPSDAVCRINLGGVDWFPFFFTLLILLGPNAVFATFNKYEGMSQQVAQVSSTPLASPTGSGKPCFVVTKATGSAAQAIRKQDTLRSDPRGSVSCLNIEVQCVFKPSRSRVSVAVFLIRSKGN